MSTAWNAAAGAASLLIIPRVVVAVVVTLIEVVVPVAVEVFVEVAVAEEEVAVEEVAVAVLPVLTAWGLVQRVPPLDPT
eukprot:s1048_g6.t1